MTDDALTGYKIAQASDLTLYHFPTVGYGVFQPCGSTATATFATTPVQACLTVADVQKRRALLDALTPAEWEQDKWLADLLDAAARLTPDHWRTLADALGGEDLRECFADLGMA